MESRAGVGTLTRMEALDAIGESLEREERMLDAEDRDLREELREDDKAPPTGGGKSADTGGGGPMKVLAARDVQVNHNYPAPPPEVPVVAEVLPAAKKTAGTVAKIALASAVPLAAALGYWLKPTSPPAPDADTQYELRIGPPEIPGQ